jgi:metal-responsive CopG/Arc/MetJ family transcriptional regulator
MKGKKAQAHMKTQSTASSVRASISFPLDLYETLEELAKQKRVSLAWVVRDATVKYIADHKPMSRKHLRKSDRG